jgi:hypothetical protein
LKIEPFQAGEVDKRSDRKGAKTQDTEISYFFGAEKVEGDVCTRGVNAD